jgi:hypothetical protein
MKRFLIGACAVALATWLSLALLNRRNNPDPRNERLTAALPKAVSGARPEKSRVQPLREEVGPAAQTDGPLTRKGPRERKFELAQEELARRPELKAALDNNLRRLVRDAYGDLETLLGIDRASARRLVDLLYEQEMVANDAVSVMRKRGIHPGDPGYDSVLDSFRQELDAEKKAIVGEEKFKLLLLAPQVQKKQLEIAKYYGGEFREIDAPLSSDRSLELAIVMAQFPVSDSPNDPIQAAVGPEQYLRPQSDVPLLAAAAKILTPAQLEVIRRRLVEQNMEKDFQRQMEEEVFPAHGLK